MNLTRLKYIKSTIAFLAILFVIGIVGKYEILSSLSKALIFPLFVWLYLEDSDIKSKLFTGFLLAFSIAELSSALAIFNDAIFLYISKTAYIVGFLCLLVHMMNGFNTARLIKKFKPYLIILTLFNGYVIYVINQMVLADNTIEVYTMDFLIECAYNVCILLVLSVSLINYLYHDSKRGLILFLASVCIVFSEMVQVAYIFVPAQYLLNILYSILMVAGFYLVYVYIVTKMNKYYNLLS